MLNFSLSRRAFTLGGAGLLAAAAFPASPVAASPRLSEFHLRADARGALSLKPTGPQTAVWGYNGRVPGPEIRVRQGDRVRIIVDNALREATTVHWHGLRVPNAMDGVPHLTQKPIAPGERFVYEFEAVDAGTFWYHPHQRSFEQVGRGLYGPLIIEEAEPLPVDRELTWLLDDWRLLPDGSISDDFGRAFDMNHNGRVGNTVTINGQAPDRLAVRAGERVRLRLINAANARIFGLEFDGHEPWIIALDGQPVEPHRADGGRIVLGPAMRIDLLLDMTGAPHDRFAVRDTYYEDLEYQLLEMNYGPESALRSEFSVPPVLPANPLAEPNLSAAERHSVVFAGGMNGNLKGAMLEGRWQDIRSLSHAGKLWAINGVAAAGHLMAPLLRLQRGQSYILALDNDTDWHHPIHFHGHSFRVITRGGQPTRHREWQDTVLMAPHEQVELALVADNPGDWMFHCHILEHQASGMMGVIRVT